MLLTLGALGLAAGTAAYNAYQAYKTNKYQKSVQNQIFNREDTAIQRQVSDAEKAGYNKFAVMGNNGAGAGSVVSVTQPTIDDSLGGKFIDALNARAQLSVNKSSADIARAQALKAESDASTAIKANKAYQAQIASELVKTLRENGVPANFSYDKNGEHASVSADWVRDNLHNGSISTDFTSTPAGQEFENYYSQQSSKTSILETDERYRDAKAIMDLIGTALGGGASAVTASANAYKARKGLKK